jgi:phage FluMu protein Com
MPIRFRCSYCNRLLGIATRKAGMETTCPHCGYTITVPVPHEEGHTERMNLDDVEAALGQGATEVVPPSAVAAPPAPPAAPLPPPVEKPRPEPQQPLVQVFQKPAQVAVAKPRTPATPPPPPAAPKPAVPFDPNDPPLFERDMDEILGKTAAPAEEEREKKPKVSGMDALSLGEPSHQIVISAQKATLLMIVVVVMLVMAFAAGYFLAPRG